MRSLNGACIESYVYIVGGAREQSLLGKADAMKLDIVALNLRGTHEEVSIDETEVTNRVSRVKKGHPPKDGIVSGEQTQYEIDKNMLELISCFPSVFRKKTGKFKGVPIKIQLHLKCLPCCSACTEDSFTLLRTS